MAKVKATNHFLRIDDAKTKRKRIRTILRGVGGGIPLRVPKYLYPCSRCLTLVRWRDFDYDQPNYRIEPVCNKCREAEE